MSAEDFYLHARSRQVSKMETFAMLRDLYDLDLAQCLAIAAGDSRSGEPESDNSIPQ
jgi:hypothetical protein